MRFGIRIALLVSLVVPSGACLSAAQHSRLEHDGGAPYTAVNRGFTVTVPKGWIFVENPPDLVMATIHHVRLQRIIVKYTGLEDPLPSTHVVLTPDLGPSALADSLIDDVRADSMTDGLTILESGPATIDGVPGCKFVARFRNRELADAEMVKMCYGAVHDSRLYILVYDARAGDYYDQGVPAFEETVKTFAFGKR